MEDQINRKLGAELRRWRQKKRLTQTQLAKRARVHLNTVCKCESAQAGMQVRTLIQICAALKISPATILTNLQGERN